MTSSDASSSSTSSNYAKQAWAGHKIMGKKLSKPLRKSKPKTVHKPPPSKKNQLLLDSFLSCGADLDMGLDHQTNSPLDVKILQKK